MRTYYHTLHHLRAYGRSHALMYRVFVMIFFWAIFDGIVTYILPLLITSRGFSPFEMGIILGSSSFAGALFDIVASKYLTNPQYRRLFAVVFMLSGIFLALLYAASTLIVFLVAMALWGIYWDVYHFATADFISRTLPEIEHSSGFGIQGVFQSLGVIVAPILVGLTIETTITSTPFVIAGVMLLMSVVVYLFVLGSAKKSHHSASIASVHTTTLSGEARIWLMLGKTLAPVLVLTFLIYIIDAIFWTIGPLIAEHGEFGAYGGFFMAAYSFPTLIVGWFVGSVTQLFGKKKTALYALLAGCAILSSLTFVQNPYIMIAVVAGASVFIGMAFPALNGAYADYISETQVFEKEIQAIVDIFYNFGWMLGPMVGGFLAEMWGTRESISMVGAGGVTLCIFMLFVMPKKIRIPQSVHGV